MGQQLGRYESEVRRSERLRTLEQLAAGMAHQFRNAAAGARLAIELHEQQCPLGADCETLQVAMRQLRLIESYLQRFLSLGSAGAAPRQEVALGGLVEDVLALVRPACSHAGIELSLAQPAEAVRIRGDPESLRQLVVNLALNGMEAAARSGAAARRVAVRVERRGADRVLLRVEDTGPGPSPEVAPRLFEPFVTDKPDGTGLGLSVARQIAEAHGASIGWDRRGGMTCFTVDFPCEGK